VLFALTNSDYIQFNIFVQAFRSDITISHWMRR